MTIGPVSLSLKYIVSQETSTTSTAPPALSLTSLGHQVKDVTSWSVSATSIVLWLFPNQISPRLLSSMCQDRSQRRMILGKRSLDSSASVIIWLHSLVILHNFWLLVALLTLAPGTTLIIWTFPNKLLLLSVTNKWFIFGRFGGWPHGLLLKNNSGPCCIWRQ